MPLLPDGFDWSAAYALAAQPETEADFAALRLTSRTYISKTFLLQHGTVQDLGQPARYVHRVFDHRVISEGTPEDDYEWTEYVVRESPGGRVQITLQVARTAGAVRKIQLRRVTTTKAGSALETLVEFDRTESSRLVSLIKLLDDIPIEGDTTVLVDDDLVRDLADHPEALQALYAHDPERFRRFIESDVSAEDLVAVAYRRGEVEEFRNLLHDDDYFDLAATSAGGPEKVWQQFLERNPWVLGLGLSGQLLTSWDDEKLERTVAGSSVVGAGKRVDALLQTNGRLNMLAFAEIKHHRTPLLHHDQYRAGCWAPSHDLSGGVTQVQQTVHRALDTIGERLHVRGADGAETGQVAFLMQPRSYLIVGHLNQLTGVGGVHPEKHRSFEVYRQNLHRPEIVTFDELLARAEWSVALAESSGG
ncbi:uncharacterized protein DUF4263 [Motilibacter peucedani]|uniref:Uncharacterized protein DUF4263 n=1 Tax=Motilibacter peucedani TaxID=598650 RepID=A0A420XUX6_9ACTN|nr:Shedu immune nuclease family protein [Motilibacter peucedani]RKS80653.1 uncharacterized protein DUF4263 [Motilibacter peucedani]